MDWKTAFLIAWKYILYTIIWVMAGFIFIFMGIAGATSKHYGIAILFILIGYIVSGIGVMASFFKVLGDVVSKEIEKVYSREELSKNEEIKRGLY